MTAEGAPPDGAAGHGRAAFGFVWVTVALDMVAIGLMAPVLPRLVVEFEAGQMAAAARITGWFALAWAAIQFVAAPMLGALSDRFGRRPVIILSNLGTALDYVLMAVAPSLSWLFVGRVISGITSASYPTANAYVADVTPPEQRAARYGLLGAAFGLGFVLGPALGGVLGAINLRLPFWAAAGLSLANATYGYFVLPESLPPALRRKTKWHLANPLTALDFLRTHAGLGWLAAAAFLYYLAHEVLPTLFALYTQYRYQWSARDVGVSLAVVGVCQTIVAAVVVGPAVKRLGERRALQVGLLCGALSCVIFGLAPTGAVYLAGIPLACLGGLTTPSLQAMATRSVDPSEQGRLQGALGSLQSIALLIGPLMFANIFAAATATTVPGAPMFLGGALLFAAMLVAWRRPVAA